jgi:hypothetical protein
MDMGEIRTFVEEENTNILENYEERDTYDSLSEYLAYVDRSAHRVGLGLLHIDRPGDARRWFTDLSPAWIDGIQSEWEFKLEEGSHIGLFPWLEVYNALSASVLSDDEEVIEESAKTVWEQATAPELDALPGQDEAARPRIVRAFAALLLDREDGATYVAEARKRLSDDRYDQEYLGSQVDAIEAIEKGDEDATRAAVESALAFHEASFADNEDMHFVEEAVSTDACTFLTLARSRGLDVRVDSEYIPEAVYELA